MRTTTTAYVLLACTLLASGCRTIHRSRDRVTAEDIPFETVDQPSRIARSTAGVRAPESAAPVAAAPVVEAPVVEAPDVGSSAIGAPVAELPVFPPAVEAPVAAAPAEPPAGAEVAPPPAVAVPAPAATPKKVRFEPVTAERTPMDTTPYEVRLVKSASEVGKPGSYVEQIIPEDGGDKAFAIEAGGLTGSTGRHVPAPAPAPEPVPVVKQAPAGTGVYVVQPGDILGRIAIKHGVSRQSILDANPSIKNPDKLKVGQKLKIPARGTGITDRPKVSKPAAAPAAAKPKKALPAKDGFTVYTVKKGDILGRIAKAHGTTQKAILAANDIKNADRIREGQQLYVPVAGSAPAAKPAAKPVVAPAFKPAAKPVAKPAGKPVKVIDKPVEDKAAPPPSDASADDILKSLGL